MRLMMRSSTAWALSRSWAAAIFSDRSTESGWMRTSALRCSLTVAGSRTRSDFLSPEAFLTACSAALITASLSKDVAVP